MKIRKHVWKLAVFFAVVAMLLGGTVSVWARDIQKGYRLAPGNSSFEIELNPGESISKIKVNKKGLKIKVIKNCYDEYKVVDKKKNAEYNKANPDDQEKDCRRVYLRAFATKTGKYKVTFDIKKGKKTVKKKQKITVYVGELLTSVKFAGKTYKFPVKYMGSKYANPFYYANVFVTKKSKGKFSVKAGYGYKVVGIAYETYNAKTKEWTGIEKAYKKGSTVKLIKEKSRTDTYDRENSGVKCTSKYTPDTSYLSFSIYLKDTLYSKNNEYTSKYAKGKYAEIMSVSFRKY